MKLSKRLLAIIGNAKVLFWAFLFMLVLPGLVMFFTEPTGLLTRIIQIVLPLAVFWFAMTLNRNPGKMFWWLFFFMFLDAFQIVLLYLFGESPIAVDMFLNVVTTNVTEVDELLGNLITAVSTVFIIYGGGIVVAIMALRSKPLLSPEFLKRQRRNALILLVPVLALIGINYAVDKRFIIEDDVFPINGTYNFLLSFSRYSDVVNYKENSKNFTYNATTERPDSLPEVYVLVLGETVRASNCNLYGYERNTMPELAAIGDQLVVFRDAITMSNTTHKSVPLLLTPIGSEHFDSLYTQKGIFTAFKEAGYKTSFYSNQRRNGSFIDFLGSEAEDAIFAMDNVLLGSQSDDVLIDLFKKRLAGFKGEKLFFVLHCYGSHFNYADRYPKRPDNFMPDDIPSAKPQYRDNMINAYDNTIRYTDRLVKSIINGLDSLNVPSTLIFLSDHGEDIFDDRRNRFLHASPIPTFYQLNVPFIVWTSDEYRSQYPDKWAALNAHKDMPVSTSMVVFHTILDLAGVNTTYAKPELAVSNDAFKPVARLYVNDHNDFRTMDNAGLKDLDIEQFKLHNMVYP
ncbi:MAG: phosphoethanolamine transferase [Muribaculaceae bacterium]|mgnify:FL=1|nr:phosphoethanolamine transferase [Muribaculaceae bacterium]